MQYNKKKTENVEKKFKCKKHVRLNGTMLLRMFLVNIFCLPMKFTLVPFLSANNLAFWFWFKYIFDDAMIFEILIFFSKYIEWAQAIFEFADRLPVNYWSTYHGVKAIIELEAGF